MSSDNSINSTTSNNINNIINDYTILKTLGEGTFCKVKLGIHRPTNTKVAIKILEKNHLTYKEDHLRMQREFDMITSFSHPNVISVSEIIENQHNFYIIMEYCQEGELFHYIVQKRKLKESEASFFYYQLINGLEYIHSQGIVHRDLKPENLLLTNEHLLKIIDFGLSNYYKESLLSTPCGSPCYASPEMVSGHKYDGYKIDVWSTGIILYAMLCGYLPFEHQDNEKLFKQILRCKLVYPKHISENAKDLMNKVLVVEPHKRIAIKEIKEHPFYLKGKEIFMHEFSYRPVINELLSLDDEIERDIMSHELKTEGDFIEQKKINKAVSNNIRCNNQEIENRNNSNIQTYYSELNSLSVINTRNNQTQMQTTSQNKQIKHNNNHSNISNTNINNNNSNAKRISIQTIAYKSKDNKSINKKQSKPHKSTANTQYNTLKKIIINTEPNLRKITNFSSHKQKHSQSKKKSLQYHPNKTKKQNPPNDKTHTKSQISQSSFADTSIPYTTTEINITNYRNSNAITSMRSPQNTTITYKKKIPSIKNSGKHEQGSLLYNLSSSKKKKGSSQVKIVKQISRAPINALHKKLTKTEQQLKELRVQNKLITNRNLINYLKSHGDIQKRFNYSSCEHSASGIMKTKRQKGNKKKSDVVKDFKPLSLERKKTSKSGVILTSSNCNTPKCNKRVMKYTCGNNNNNISNNNSRITYRNIINVRQSAPTQMKSIFIKELLESLIKKSKNVNYI